MSGKFRVSPERMWRLHLSLWRQFCVQWRQKPLYTRYDVHYLCLFIIFCVISSILYFCFNPQCQSAVYRVYSLYKSWYRNLTKMYKAKVQRRSLENIWIYSCLLKKSRLGNHLFTNEDQLIVLTYVSVLVFPWLGEKRYLSYYLNLVKMREFDFRYSKYFG